ncbi:response regulator transcription factor [Weissella coleopterorum]|uniref:Response regulator transcription factor n=1 Tax=Weissella coleopterorum TaxID=2714949 RepID=A0A6G8B0B8_9LACO|nr:response regulator transcription factor [Weissella coleopterorum]QIL50754.1 response regulator transcription factor [Weissella coleopterorum]
MNKTLLLIEDEVALANSLATEFKFENFDVLIAKDGQDGLKTFEKYTNIIDIIILDWMLPKMSGMNLLREIRKISQVPIIMLTARNYISDKVMALSNGADDYITKPFELEELLIRIKVALRHTQKSVSDQLISINNLKINLEKTRVCIDDKIIALTKRECDLLVYLMTNKDRTCSRNDLLDAVWGVDFTGQPNIVDVYIRNLRHKIPRNLIHTIRNQGYMISNNYIE